MDAGQLSCPHCGVALAVEKAKRTTVCPGCRKVLAVANLSASSAKTTEAAESQPVVAVEGAKLNEAYLLLETDIASPVFDANMREAEQKFKALVKSDKSNYLAWSGLFGCLLHQCKKTYIKQEKIPGTEYWLQPNTNVFQDLFQVEGYFNRVLVDEQGKFRSFQYDSILQPGRKAKLYLENAVDTAEGSEKESMQKLLDKYFTNAPTDMAQKGLEYLLEKRDDARQKDKDRRLRGRR